MYKKYYWVSLKLLFIINMRFFDINRMNVEYIMCISDEFFLLWLVLLLLLLMFSGRWNSSSIFFILFLFFLIFKILFLFLHLILFFYFSTSKTAQCCFCSCCLLILLNDFSSAVYAKEAKFIIFHYSVVLFASLLYTFSPWSYHITLSQSSSLRFLDLRVFCCCCC